MKITIYHNPRCSKSRQTLQLVEERGITPTIIEYLVTPPDKTELHHILKLLGINARDLLRKSEALYRELDLGNPDLSNDELTDAMVQNPILIERPIVIADNNARIGRPPESVLEIL